MRRSWLAILLLAGLAVPAEGSTVFSSNGYGWWWDEGDAASAGRGGTTAAWSDYGLSGAANPASIAASEMSYGFASYGAEVASVKGEEGSFRQRADLLPHLGGVVVLPKGIRAGGLFRVQTDATFTRRVRFEGESPYTVETTGKGGWTRLQLQLAGSVFDRRLAWGGALGRIQGNVKEEWTVVFDDPRFRRHRQINEGRVKGGWVGGVGFLARPVERLQVGGAFTLGGSTAVARETAVLAGGSLRRSTRAAQELPDEWTIGLLARPSRSLRIAGDFGRALWADAGFTPAPGEAEQKPYDDASRWGIGVEIGAENGPLPARVLRAGFRGRTSYLRAADGSEIGEWAATAGLRLPVAKERGALDLSLEYGKRGDRGDLGVEETFVRFTAGLAFSSIEREY